MQRSRGRRPGARARWVCRTVAVAVLVVWLVPAAAATDVEEPQARLRSKQAIPVFYNQGIARVRGGWILSGTLSPIPDTDALVRTDEQFNVLVENKPAIPPKWRARGYNHIGDIDVVGNVVYAPFEQPDFTNGHQVTARYDARNLHFMDAVVLAQHENSFVTVDPATRIAYSMDRFDGKALLRYDAARGWKRLAPLRLSTVLHHTQGASVASGAVWISTSDASNDLYRVSMKTGHVDLIGQIVDPLGEGEGIDATPLPSGGFHAMVLDPDMTKVWVEHFSRPSTPRQAGPQG
jgi:hypothetical protein